MPADDEIYDFFDIDCEDCGIKFYVRPHSASEMDKKYPTRCLKCRRAHELSNLHWLLAEGVCP